MPKSAFALQEDDFGRLIIGTVDHSTGAVNVHRKLHNFQAEYIRGGIVKGENYILGYDHPRNVTIRDLDGEIVHQSRTLINYVDGNRASVTGPFSLFMEWKSYGDKFYTIITKDWSTYSVFVIDMTGSTPVESEVAFDTNNLPYFDKGELFFNGSVIFAVGKTSDKFIKVLKNVPGNADWTELHSVSYQDSPAFQYWSLRPTKDQEYFFFTPSFSSKNFSRLVLNTNTEAVTLDAEYFTNVWAQSGGLYNGSTEEFCVEAGAAPVFYQNGYQNSDFLAYGYAVNVTMEAGQAEDGIGNAVKFTRNGYNYAYISGLMNYLYYKYTHRVKFKPDLTQNGIFLSGGQWGQCIVLTTDGKLQLRSSQYSLTHSTNPSTVLDETPAGFIQGGVWNRLTWFFKEDNTLVLANDSGSGPVIVTLTGIPYQNQWLFGSNGISVDQENQMWDGYVDGFARYTGTWQNFDYFGMTLNDATPTIDTWTDIATLPNIRRREDDEVVGEFIKAFDDNTSETSWQYVKDNTFNNVANNVDHERDFALTFPNGDTSNENVGRYGGIFNIEGTDVVLHITEYSVDAVSRSTGVILGEYVHDTNDNREFGYEYCQAVYPVTTEYVLSGTVTDDGANPIAGVVVQMLAKDGKQILAETTTNGAGQYSFTCFTANKKVLVAKNPANPTANYQVRAHLEPVAV